MQLTLEHDFHIYSPRKGVICVAAYRMTKAHFDGELLLGFSGNVLLSTLEFIADRHECERKVTEYLLACIGKTKTHNALDEWARDLEGGLKHFPKPPLLSEWQTDKLSNYEIERIQTVK